jgi:hypothetical protein
MPAPQRRQQCAAAPRLRGASVGRVLEAGVGYRQPQGAARAREASPYIGPLPDRHVRWLVVVAGRDRHALRELAGLNGRDVREIRNLLPAALAEMSIALPPTVAAAAVVVFDGLARQCLPGEAGGTVGRGEDGFDRSRSLEPRSSIKRQV